MIAGPHTLPSCGAPVEWIKRSALDLELSDESFDVVLCQQGLQFFPPVDDAGLLLQMVADTIQLMRHTKAAIERLDDVDHALYLEPFRNLELMFSQLNLEATWEPSKGRLDTTTLYGLRMAADRLSRVSGYSHIDNEELEALRKDLDALLSDALEADMPAELKMPRLLDTRLCVLKYGRLRAQAFVGIAAVAFGDR